MLLQHLVRYARSQVNGGPRFHREREFHWELTLTEDGDLVHPGLRRLQSPDKPTRGVTHLVPTVVRTAGVAANLAADDVQYVLGWGDENSKPARVTQCHEAFVDLVQRWAASEHAREDPVAQAVARFYRRRELLAALDRPEEIKAKQGVLIRVGTAYAYTSPSVEAFWAEEVARRKGGGRLGLCLVCGQEGPLLDTVPGKVPARLVPGADNDAALVSVNREVFGYDLVTGLEHTPICMPCGDALSTGLTALLSSDDTITYPRQDTRFAWWTTDPERGAAVVSLLQKPNTQRIQELVYSPFSGKRPKSTGKADSFYSLSVGGNGARIVVRDWVEMPLGDLERNIAQWFADHEVANLRQDGNRVHSLWTLALAAGRWDRRAGRYAEFTAKNSARPHDVQRDLLQAAIRRRPLPRSLLAHLVQRIRTDGRVDGPRAALLRLARVRDPHRQGEPPMPDLDPTNTTPVYLAGRAFAVLEAIQHAAHHSESRGNAPSKAKQSDTPDTGDSKETAGLNTTYADRFFAGAVLNPRMALVNGCRDAQAWLRKLRRTKPRLAAYFQQQLATILGSINAGTDLPARTGIDQQADFILGYYHQLAQRGRARNGSDNGDVAETPSPDTSH